MKSDWSELRPACRSRGSLSDRGRTFWPVGLRFWRVKVHFDERETGSPHPVGEVAPHTDECCARPSKGVLVPRIGDGSSSVVALLLSSPTWSQAHPPASGSERARVSATRSSGTEKRPAQHDVEAFIRTRESGHVSQTSTPFCSLSAHVYVMFADEDTPYGAPIPERCGGLSGRFRVGDRAFQRRARIGGALDGSAVRTHDATVGSAQSRNAENSVSQHGQKQAPPSNSRRDSEGLARTRSTV